MISATLALSLLLAPSAAPVGPQAATVELDRGQAAIGQTVTVRLAGWPTGNVAVELCGNGRQRGTADCAVASSATTFVTAQGTASVLLSVVKPPIDCPCVVAAHPVSGGEARTAPLTVKGVRVLTRTERAQVAPVRNDLTITRVRVSGGGPSLAWLGLTARRTVSITLRNDGRTPVTGASLNVAAGRSPDPTGVVDAPALGTIEPGQERSYRIPVSFAAPALGTYLVQGDITGIDRPIHFTARTASYPWALPALALALLALSTVRKLRRGPAGHAARPSPVTAHIITVHCPNCHTPTRLSVSADVGSGRADEADDRVTGLAPGGTRAPIG